MTNGELIALLAEHDPGLVVTVNGYDVAGVEVPSPLHVVSVVSTQPPGWEDFS